MVVLVAMAFPAGPPRSISQLCHRSMPFSAVFAPNAPKRERPAVVLSAIADNSKRRPESFSQKRPMSADIHPCTHTDHVDMRGEERSSQPVLIAIVFTGIDFAIHAFLTLSSFHRVVCNI